MAQESTGPRTEGTDLHRLAEADPSTLGEKLGAGEQAVKHMMHDATTSMAGSVDAVKEAVTDSVDTVKGAMREAATSLGKAFDLRHHVRHHPWFTLGVAVFVGYVAANLLGRLRR